MSLTLLSPLEDLRNATTWPADPCAGDFGPCGEFSGMFATVMLDLSRQTLPKFPTVLCLGCGTGEFLAFLLRCFPDLAAIAVDSWKGLAGQRVEEKLFETFAHTVADYQHRVVPLQQHFALGIKTVKEYGIEPTLLCVRGKFMGEGFTETVRWALANFPAARAFGDGADLLPNLSVLQGVAQVFKQSLHTYGDAWWFMEGI